jgi:hypothetical protein
LTTIASWLLRGRTTTASSSLGFSSRCGVNGRDIDVVARLGGEPHLATVLGDAPRIAGW